MVSASPWCWACSPLPTFRENIEINTGLEQGYSDTYANILPSSSSSWFRDVLSQRRNVFLVNHPGGLLFHEHAHSLPEPTQTLSIQNFPWEGFSQLIHTLGREQHPCAHSVPAECSPHLVLPCSSPGKNEECLVPLPCRVDREKI